MTTTETEITQEVQHTLATTLQSAPLSMSKKEIAANKSIQEELSEERKAKQESGDLPQWFTTHGWQMFKEKYLWDAVGYKDTCQRIADTLARHTGDKEQWSTKFFQILWEGLLAPSTPVLSNTGTPKGCSVSCSGGYIDDSIFGFYSTRLETAVLTKNGFGTSGYLGDIRPRGQKISSGGRASGTVPVFKMFVQDMRDVAQGTSRRGSWAGYLPIDHDDFWELTDHIYNNPDDANIGYNYSDEFIARLNAGDEDALARFQRHMKLRAVTGKGYFYFTDKVARHQPQMYKDLGLQSKASNLCTEITLHSDAEHTFTCVLSSLNLSKWERIKETNAIFTATVFLDCVCEEFIQMAKAIPGMEHSVAFSEKSRALGLGTLGFHTLLQDSSIPFESFDAHRLNNEIYKRIHDDSLEASKWMAEKWGEPEWCKGYGVRNTHRTAIAPNMSSAIICGGVSQGIEPIVANVYTQASAAGEMDRINPSLLKLMKERGVFSKKTCERIASNLGSVQGETWLSDHEKEVFKTAYEIDQRAILRLASARQRWICQAQSINLFFDSGEDEGYIAKIHQEAALDPNIKSLYYLRSLPGVYASKDTCVACEG